MHVLNWIPGALLCICNWAFNVLDISVSILTLRPSDSYSEDPDGHAVLSSGERLGEGENQR